MGERVDEARAAGKVLRYKFSIDLAKGSAECGIVAVDDKDPLFRLKRNENILAFHTDRYTNAPLIIKG